MLSAVWASQPWVLSKQILHARLQASMYEAAMAFREANILDVGSYDELQSVIADGKWARGPWAGACKLDLDVLWINSCKNDAVLVLSLCPLNTPRSGMRCV